MHRLFFAIFPDPPALAALQRIAGTLQDANTLRGRWISPHQYHATVRFIGDYDDEHAAATIESARAAAGDVPFARFPIVLDRVATFRGRFRAPCVLRCSSECEAPIQSLWQQLGERLAGAGISGGDERRFLPHGTIAYSDRNLGDAIPIEPVRWEVAEFALVDSFQSQHRVVARWPARLEPETPRCAAAFTPDK
jgi:2'-5' RNA ligase